MAIDSCYEGCGMKSVHVITPCKLNWWSFIVLMRVGREEGQGKRERASERERERWERKEGRERKLDSWGHLEYRMLIYKESLIVLNFKKLYLFLRLDFPCWFRIKTWVTIISWGLLKIGHRKIIHPLGMSSKTQLSGEFLKRGRHISFTAISKRFFY